MGFSFHPDRSTGVFVLRAFGKIDDFQVIRLWDRLNHETPFITGWPILCDCSAVTVPLVSSHVIEFLAKAARARHNLVAVIAPKALVFGLARMYQINTDPDDKRIRVFPKVDEAMAWLSERMEQIAMHA